MPKDLTIAHSESLPEPALVEPLKLSLTELVLPSEFLSRSLIKECAGSAAHTLVQSPLNSLAQIVDKTLDTDVLSRVQLVSPIKSADFGTAQWHVQVVGNALGMMLPFIAMHCGSRTLGKVAGLDIHKSGELTVRQYRNEVLMLGSTGLAYGALLTPSNSKDSLLFGRLKNATEHGLTFATLGLAAGGLKLWGHSIENRLGSRLLGNNIVGGILAGIPAGSVSADTSSILAGNGLATWKERAQAAYGLIFMAGALGTSQALRESFIREPNLSSSQAISEVPTAKAPLKISLGERGRLGASEVSVETRTEAKRTPEITTDIKSGASELSASRETYRERKAREAIEGQRKLDEFLNKPNPTSLAESCRQIAAELRLQMKEIETSRQEAHDWYKNSVVKFEDAAAKLEEFAKTCTPETSMEALHKLVDQISQFYPQIKTDIRNVTITSSPAVVAAELANYPRKQITVAEKNACWKAEDSVLKLQRLRAIIQIVEEYPQRFQNDNPANIMDLPRLIRDSDSKAQGYEMKPFVEAVYEHAPARLVFTTEKGSAYRVYLDGSLGRFKSNGHTRDRCDAQYFTDHAEGQRLLEAAKLEGLGGFSIPVQLEPAIGLVPLSLYEAGRPSPVLPVLSDGRLIWPSASRVSWDGHIGHRITSLKCLMDKTSENALQTPR